MNSEIHLFSKTMAPASGTDTYRPRYPADEGPPAAPAAVQKAMYEFRGNHSQGRGIQSQPQPPPGGFTFRHAQRQGISSRPLLTERRVSSPDPIFRGEDTINKFREVDDLTDSEVEDMDVSQFNGDDEQPISKRLRSGNSWSNPDPYTVLPPVTETQKKKKDVVKLIRRSRVTTTTTAVSQSTLTTPANGDDFISLDMGDDPADHLREERYEPPTNAPTGPKSQPPDTSTQLGKRKRDAVDDVGKLPPRAKKGARLHQGGRIVEEWKGLSFDSSTPWYRPPSTPDCFAGVA